MNDMFSTGALQQMPAAYDPTGGFSGSLMGGPFSLYGRQVNAGNTGVVPPSYQGGALSQVTGSMNAQTGQPAGSGALTQVGGAPQGFGYTSGPPGSSGGLTRTPSDQLQPVPLPNMPQQQIAGPLLPGVAAEQAPPASTWLGGAMPAMDEIVRELGSVRNDPFKLGTVMRQYGLSGPDVMKLLGGVVAYNDGSINSGGVDLRDPRNYSLEDFGPDALNDPWAVAGHPTQQQLLEARIKAERSPFREDYDRAMAGIGAAGIAKQNAYSDMMIERGNEKQTAMNAAIANELERVRQSMVQRGFNENQIAPYLDEVRSQFYQQGGMDDFANFRYKPADWFYTMKA